jgi:hypothetical protein
MSGLARAAGPVHVGMDTPENAVMAAVLWPGDGVPATERIVNDEPPVRRLLGRIAGTAGGAGRLRCCYEPGRVVMTCTGCWRRWGSRAMWWRRC